MAATSTDRTSTDRTRDDPGRRPHVVVVGGGISGLAAAHALRAASPGVRVTVLEGEPRVGGKLDLADVDGLPVDQGAESVLVRRPEALDLIGAVGLGDDLVRPGAVGASVWSRGALRPLPRTLMGVPTDVGALASSGVMSRRGLARVRLDRLLPRSRHVADRDVPIGWYVGHRLGREVVDRLVEPLLGGVYAGDPDGLSLAATVPTLAGPARAHRSLLAAATSATAAGRPEPVAAGGSGAVVPTPPDGERGSPFASLRGGLGRLPAAVAIASGATVRTSSTVRQLTRTPDGWQVVVGPTAAPQVVDADAVIIAVPAGPARRLLAGTAPRASAALAGLSYASMAIVTLVLDPRGLRRPLQGTGFLVPATEGRLIKAATYLTSKWGWLAEQADGRLVVRCSVGRHGEVTEIQRDPEELARAAAADLAAMAGTPLHPLAWRVRKWGGALPQYAVGHVERVAEVRAGVAAVPGLAVCGAAYDGIGVAACIGSASAAAGQVLAYLESRAQ